MTSISRKIIATVPRVILGLFFCLSAVLKLISLTDFELYVFSFGFASFDLCSVAARLLVAGEAVLGLGLLSGWWWKFTSAFTALLLLGFSGFLFWRLSLGDEASCHCFGTLVDMNPSQSLWKNAACMLLLLPVAFCGGGWQIPFPKRARLWTASATGLVLLIAICIINPPDAYFRIFRGSSSDLNTAAFEDADVSLPGRKIICFYSPYCEHCRHCIGKISGIIRRNGLSTDDFFCIFMNMGDGSEDRIHELFENEGAGLELPYILLEPETFIPITNGSIPLVCLFEDSALIKEYDLLRLDEVQLSDFLRYNTRCNL